MFLFKAAASKWVRKITPRLYIVSGIVSTVDSVCLDFFSSALCVNVIEKEKLLGYTVYT